MKACERQQPTFRLKIHSPANPLHRHIDEVVQFKDATDYGAWVKLIQGSMRAMGYENDRFVLGFYLDLLNSLPEPYRWALIRGIVEGRGLKVSLETGEEGSPVIVIGLPQKYEPLAGARETESGLVIPGRKPVGSDLALPGSEAFQEVPSGPTS